MFIQEKYIGLESIKKAIVCLVALAILMGKPLTVRAEETSICHSHDNSCYSSGWMDCEDGVKVTTHNEEFNCTTCGRIAAARVVVESYACDYITFEREFRRIAYCYTCGNIVQNATKSASAVHRRLANVLVCGINEGTVLTKVVLESTSNAWTKDNVILKVTVTEPTAGKSLAPYQYSFSGGNANGSSCTVDSNGIYTVTVTGNNGQQSTTSIQVNNIDKEAPKINRCYVDKEYPEYEEANIVIEATDSLSGLSNNAYSFDGGKNYGNSAKFRITANGTYTVFVKDKVGNTSSKTLTVTCFEKKPEVKPDTSKENDANSSSGNQSAQNGNTPQGGHNNQGGYSAQNGQIGGGSGAMSSPKDDTDTSETNTGKKKTTTQNGDENTAADLERELLKQKLEKSDKRVALEDIPGMYSSVLKTNAEKNAVPMTLSVVSKQNKNMYSAGGQSTENLVKNITLDKENNQRDGSFAQVSRAVVGAGVLLCIGMVGFLIMFLVKKH